MALRKTDFETIWRCDQCTRVVHSESPDELPPDWQHVLTGWFRTRHVCSEQCRQWLMHHPMEAEMRYEILHIDDEEIEQVLLSTLLSTAVLNGMGIRLTQIDSITPVDFIPDLVLLDLRLADSMGYRTVQRCRKMYDGVPIVVLSGYLDNSLSNAEAYFPKERLDLHSSQLLRIMGTVLQSTRPVGELRYTSTYPPPAQGILLGSD